MKAEPVIETTEKIALLIRGRLSYSIPKAENADDSGFVECFDKRDIYESETLHRY